MSSLQSGFQSKRRRSHRPAGKGGCRGRERGKPPPSDSLPRQANFPTQVEVGPSLSNSQTPLLAAPSAVLRPQGWMSDLLAEALAGDKGTGWEAPTSSSLTPDPCVSTPGLASRPGSEDKKKPGQAPSRAPSPLSQQTQKFHTVWFSEQLCLRGACHCPRGSWAWKPLEQPLGAESTGAGVLEEKGLMQLSKSGAPREDGASRQARLTGQCESAAAASSAPD